VGGSLPNVDLPGTFASWTSAPLANDVDVAGVPMLTVRVLAPSAALTQAAGPAGDLVLFARLYDVAPGGTASLIHGLVAPVRVSNVNDPVRITLPGVVHRFAAGHRLEVVLAGGDVNYRGGLISTPVVVAGGAQQVLTLPVVS
jgi:ABC-2 type transport system ATP-binding protein